LKTLLGSEVEQLKAEVKALQQERNLYQELIEQRLKQPQNTSWWQQIVNNASTVVSSVTSAVKIGINEFKENSKQHQFAASIKNLFQLQTQPGENQYQAGDYQISRNGSHYEVKDSATDKLLMQFRDTNLGVKVEKSDLVNVDIQDINSLQKSLQKNEPIPASFAPVGKQEAEYFARVERVTNALVEYAAVQQRDVEIDGRFSYKWKASPDGNVQIEAKDGRGNLLEKTGGQLTSNMNERDLNYFEQILPKLQPKSKGRRQELDSTNELTL
jgi:gas vesicle protein